jgi:hypothetical protein
MRKLPFSGPLQAGKIALIKRMFKSMSHKEEAPIYSYSAYIKVKVNTALEQALKAQRQSRGIALLFL